MIRRPKTSPLLALILSLLLSAPVGWTFQLQSEEEAPPPLTYSAKPVRGLVVDAGTGQPLDGVIVVAQWILHEPGKGSWRRLHVLETTTDAKGNFLIAGWGPKDNTWYPWTRLLTADPALSFFKRGYTPQFVQNRWVRNEPMRISEWDGKTIKLEKFTGTDQEWKRRLRLLQTALAWGDVMDWRQVPRMTLAILEERERLPKSLRVGLGASEELGTTTEEVDRFLEAQK